MRAVIEGLRYDTETATLVASWSNGNDTGSFHYFEEALYQTRRGKWFIAGRGNARSPYRESLGDRSWGPGSRIRPLAPQEALAWLEERGKANQIDEYFSDEIEDA